MRQSFNGRSIVVAAALAAGLTACKRAEAQTLCGDRDEIVQSLLRSYQEQPVAIGLSSAGAIVEVLASPRGTWTLMMTMPTGQTCVMAAGEHWEALPQLAGEPS